MDEQTSIEFLILANHVEALNGLLYISGGGWTDHHRIIRDGPPPFSHLGVGLSILVPWNQTNLEHRLSVVIEQDEGNIVVARTDAQLNVGRPPAPVLPPGAEQHVVVAMAVDTVFPSAGNYHVIAHIDDDSDRARRWSFRVHDMPAITLSAPVR